MWVLAPFLKPAGVAGKVHEQCDWPILKGHPYMCDSDSLQVNIRLESHKLKSLYVM
jgi:hypothetical protein